MGLSEYNILIRICVLLITSGDSLLLETLQLELSSYRKDTSRQLRASLTTYPAWQDELFNYHSPKGIDSVTLDLLYLYNTLLWLPGNTSNVFIAVSITCFVFWPYQAEHLGHWRNSICNIHTTDLSFFIDCALWNYMPVNLRGT